jgi:hypothetical protein
VTASTYAHHIALGKKVVTQFLQKLNSLTAIGFWWNVKTPTKHKNLHHGELLPPPAAQILQLDLIRRKPVADKGLGEGGIEAIQLNRLFDSVLIYILATLLSTKK